MSTITKNKFKKKKIKGKQFFQTCYYLNKEKYCAMKTTKKKIFLERG